MGTCCSSYNELEDAKRASAWASEDSLAESRRAQTPQQASRSGSLRSVRIRPGKDKAAAVAAVSDATVRGAGWPSPHVSLGGLASKDQSLEGLNTDQVVDVLKKGQLARLGANKTDAVVSSTLLDDERVEAKYIAEHILAEGSYWILLRAKRRSDGKQLLIKKISKARIPPEELYFQACENNAQCACSKCAPWNKSRPPLELILMQSRDSGLPQLVDSFEDEGSYYIVSKMHGPSQKRWKNMGSWFGRGRWSTVYWREYLT
ncbi:hypothetical protein HK105_202233 [Polyrhizophydium stewartii]|uniref:Uncharacterized protein n=1 Tax=Polyrhizophydium stewartii TaxID=2732419 RepID=A0ABR4NFK5_9FUNG